MRNKNLGLTIRNKCGRVFSICILSGIIGSLGTGCFGGGKDVKVSHGARYRINTACSGIDLSTSTLSVQTFRDLLHCFNAYHALDPIEKLIAGLSDELLAPLVNSTNQFILNDKQGLHKIEKTFEALNAQGIVDTTFAQIGKVLENDEFFVSLISLMKDGFFQDASPAGILSGTPVNLDILQALEILAGKVTDTNMDFLFALGLNFATARASQNLQNDLKRHVTVRSTLQELIPGVFDYLSEDHLFKCNNQVIPIQTEFRRAISTGDLFTALDKTLGVDPLEIRGKLPQIAAVFKIGVSGDRAIQQDSAPEPNTSLLRKMGWAFSDLQVPIQCMLNSTTIPSAAEHMLGELAALSAGQDAGKFILQENVLTLAALKPFCKFPDALATHYPTLQKFAQQGWVDPNQTLTSAMTPMADMIRAFHQSIRPWQGCDGQEIAQEPYHPLTRLLIHVFADQGGGGQGGFSRLLPLLVELTAGYETSSDVLTDLLLLFDMPGGAQREWIQESLQIAVQPQIRLGGKSLSDIFMTALAKQNPVNPAQSYLRIYRFLSAAEKFLDYEDGFFANALGTVKKAYYINNIHPFVDLFRANLGSATQNTALFRTIFFISGQAEFGESIRLISEMAKEGSLKVLVQSILALSHKFAEQGAFGVNIVAQTEPPTLHERRHNLGRSDLDPLVAATYHPTSFGSQDDCNAFDLGFSLDDTTSPDFGKQLDHYLKCFNSQSNSDMTRAVEFMRTQKTVKNETLFDLSIRMIKNLTSNLNPRINLTQQEMSYLVDRWVIAFDQGLFFNLINAGPPWINSTQAGPGPVRTLLDVLEPVIKNNSVDLKELENFAADILIKPDAPQLLADLDDLQETKAGPTPDPSSEINLDSLFKTVEDWVDAKECDDLSKNPMIRRQQVELRAQEVINGAKYNVTNWDLVRDRIDGTLKPRRSWTLKEVEEWLEPMLVKIENRDESAPGKWILTALINFFRYFDLPAQGGVPDGVHPRPQFNADYLLTWFKERSDDYRTLLVFYPGEKYPRVQLANTLDLFDRVLLATDFEAPFPPYKNAALDFLTEIALAWGDIQDRNEWPPEIQEMYPQGGRRPQTLLEAVNGILKRKRWDENQDVLTSWIGLPKLPECHRDLPGFPKDKQAAGSPWLNSLLGWYLTPEKTREFQAKLFNISQVNQVLLENAPGSGMGKNGGLEVLRNLFFEIYRSTPDSVLKASYPFSMGDKNNLSFVLKTVRLGGLRQLGRLIQNFPKNDPHLKNILTTLIHSSSSPRMKEVLATLIDSHPSGKPEQRLIWKLMEQIFTVLDHQRNLDGESPDPKLSGMWNELNGIAAGLQSEIAKIPHLSAPVHDLERRLDSVVTRLKGVDLNQAQSKMELFELVEELFSALERLPGKSAQTLAMKKSLLEMNEDTSNMKQLGFYFLALMNHLEPWIPPGSGQGQDLLGWTLQRTQEVLQSHHDFLILHTDLLQKLLVSPQAASWVRALYETDDAERKDRLKNLINGILSDDTGRAGSDRVSNAFNIVDTVEKSPSAKKALTQFTQQAKDLVDSQPYKSLQLDKALFPILRFFEDRGKTVQDQVTDEEKELSKKFRFYLASLLRSGDVHEVLVAAQQKPDDFYQMLQTLGTYIGQGDSGGLKDFFRMMRRTLLEEKQGGHGNSLGVVR